ncbi:MAG: type II toxin-antitoxin system VapC family toxin [Acidobacteriota bacterium]
MKLYVLDTDICGFLQSKFPKVIEHADSLIEGDEMVTTIITFGEDLSGWMPDCCRAKDGAARAQAYARLHRGLTFYKGRDCLPFDEVAAAIFNQLRAQKIRIGTNDLAIAAITLSVNGVLVTRNAVDFQRVPNLVLEDWTK